jgi:hypothetical protein
MCQEKQPLLLNSSSSPNTKPESNNSNVEYCAAFLFVEAYAREHGEKAPDYKHCANYDSKKGGLGFGGGEGGKS